MRYQSDTTKIILKTLGAVLVSVHNLDLILNKIILFELFRKNILHNRDVDYAEVLFPPLAR